MQLNFWMQINGLWDVSFLALFSFGPTANGGGPC